MTQIIDAYLGLTALRQAGYRSTATAVAELVDNSIEAGANRIEIIAISQPILVGSRTSNQVQRIAVLDSGDGMPIDVLSNCLSLGWGTRLDTREGLGRFGFGLKGSSISQARRVEVYSWIKKGEVYRAYLDLDEIHAGKLQTLSEIDKCDLPREISSAFGSHIGDSGTLVVWDDLDQMDLKRAGTLLNRINKELCRIYRHFLDNCEEYGNKIHINLHMLDLKDGSLKTIELKANDPLYLLTPNNLPEHEDEATNVPRDDLIKVDIPYMLGGHESQSQIEFRFSVAKPTIQDLGGNSAQGKHYAQNTGISFVRAGREIDFGAFGFLDASEPRHRWWGAEIRFDPVLDELFGVTNNKQEVRAIRKLDKDVLETMSEEADHGNHKAYLILMVNKILTDHISEMMKVITGRRAGKGKKKSVAGTIAEKVNEEVRKDQTTETESKQRSDNLSQEEKINERISALLADNSALTEEEAREEAHETINYRVDILTSEWPGDLFLDRKPVANASIGIINRNTQFYEKFWRYLEEQDDTKGYEALEVMMMALVRAEDELVTHYDRKVFERFRQKWGNWVEQLIPHAGA